MTALLAYTETAIPGDVPERHELARRHQLALEVEDWGDLDPARYRHSGLQVATVQACRLKRDPPTATGRRERRRALDHIHDAIETADRLDARRIITICSYGAVTKDSPFERALETFDRAGRRARDLGVRILVEPLSPARSPAFHDPAEIVSLLRTLDQPMAFGLAIDTGHLLDGDRDPTEALAALDHPVAELQLRGGMGAPPDSKAPLEDWIGSLVEVPEVIAVEHREPIEMSCFVDLIERLRPLAG